MVSKTDDIPASVPSCNPTDPADEAGDGAQGMKESSKSDLKDSCGCGETLQLQTSFCCLRKKKKNPHLRNTVALDIYTHRSIKASHRRINVFTWAY